MIFVDIVIGRWYVFVVVDGFGLIEESIEMNNFVLCLFSVGFDLIIVMFSVFILGVVG